MIKGSFTGMAKRTGEKTAAFFQFFSRPFFGRIVGHFGFVETGVMMLTSGNVITMRLQEITRKFRL